MHPRITNISTRTLDVHRFSFESAGVFGFVNEYSGHADIPALYIAFAELRPRTSLRVTFSLQEVQHGASNRR